MTLAIVLAITNAVAFLAIAIDKRLARIGARRVPEAWLLLFAAPLASPGAWLSMSLFRHKTVKTSFRVKMIGVTLVNVAIAAGIWRLGRPWRAGA